MSKAVADAIPEIVNRLSREQDTVCNAFLGFDACIDTIARVVKEREENNDSGFFTSSRQFGEYLVAREGKSSGIELKTRISKLGGNMVITGNALGNLGVKTDCLGTFGYPEILPFFRSMSSNCQLHTIGDTIAATALEFDNTKVILFDPGPYNKLDWESISNLTGKENLKRLISGKQLISFLNWSEIEHSSGIWQGFLDEILPYISFNNRPLFFSDLSDCSRRSKEEIKKAVALLKAFRKYFKVILSLNHNEADLVARALDIVHNQDDQIFIRELSDRCNTDILIIHRTSDALACDKEIFEVCPTFLCKEPVVLTGGGDNFNAGFCFAQLHELDLFQSLIVANAVSGYYVKTGSSPYRSELLNFLAENSY
jgi:hypothetical protein